MYLETLAYVAPELACGSLRVSEKCDVYSFGVVLLELVTGRKPSKQINGATVLLADFVRTKSEQERLRDCIDPRLDADDGSEIAKVTKMALMCTSQVRVTNTLHEGLNCCFVFSLACVQTCQFLLYFINSCILRKSEILYLHKDLYPHI